MSRLAKIPLALSMVVLATGIQGCVTELSDSSRATGTLGLVTTWPDTMLVDEDSLIEIRLQLADGRQVRATTVRWSSSNPAVASVAPEVPIGGTRADTLTSALRARFSANARGEVTITISIPDSLGLVAVDTSLTITVLEHWTSISTGRDYACALNSRQEGYCWGAVGHGSAIGNGTTAGSDHPTPVLNPFPGKGFRSLSLSSDGIQYDAFGFNTFQGLTCGILEGNAAGASYCWGVANLTPTLIPGGRAFTEISIGGRRACASDSTLPSRKNFDDPFRASAFCWDPASSSVPAEIPIPGFIYDANSINFVLHGIAVGYDHACGIWEDPRVVYCWGSGGTGQLGDGKGMSSDTLVEVPFTENIVKLTAGPDHTCALTTLGDIYCWGGNADGQLGVSSVPGQGDIILSPILVNAGGLKFIDVAAGGSVYNDDVQHTGGQTCAVGVDHLAYCWGYNRYGELGIDPNTDDGCAQGYICSDHPRPVVGSPQFTAISTSSTAPFAYGSTTTHTCALTGRGQVYCWGSPWDGQLGGGSGSTPSRIREPE